MLTLQGLPVSSLVVCTSSSIVGSPAMKYSTAYISAQREERPLRFLDFIRWASLLTLWVTAVAVLIAALKVDPNVWVVIACLWFLIVFAIWFGTLAIGCLVMIPVGIWRVCKRFAPTGAEEAIPQRGLWDSWMDGPEPL